MIATARMLTVVIVTGLAASCRAASPASGGELAVTIETASVITRFDPRLLGTNAPAWLGPRLADPEFLTTAMASGVTMLRMPGGSWSNTYDWLACERRDDNLCPIGDSARPSDFASLLRETGLEGMWTVAMTATAESAAALVAFFNGDIDDERVIGVDRNGVDWGTVGEWARLRAGAGHRDPVPIRWWEVGNEVFGGKPTSGGDQCADFGWEDVWTCDGTDYVLGDAAHDGYAAIRAAMLAVDPKIAVGAVGVIDPESWSAWGTEVIAAAGDQLDFYSLHQYGFDRSPQPEEAVRQPRQVAEALERLERELDGRPIAITEYNLVSFESGDTARTMTTAMNAFYTASSIGVFATSGVTIANHWNLANGVTPSGTDYGIIHADTGRPRPAYHAVRLWSTVDGDIVRVSADAELDDLELFAVRGEADVSLVSVNAADVGRSLSVGLDDGRRVEAARTECVTAPSLTATELTVLAGADVPIASGRARLALPARSICVTKVQGDAGPGL